MITLPVWLLLLEMTLRASMPPCPQLGTKGFWPLLSFAFSQQRFSSAPCVLGKVFALSGSQFQIGPKKQGSVTMNLISLSKPSTSVSSLATYLEVYPSLKARPILTFWSCVFPSSYERKWLFLVPGLKLLPGTGK